MSESGYYKCACRHCRANIEFPAEAAGNEVPCPHCGKETLLEIPKARTPAAETPVTSPDPVKSAWDEPVPEKTVRCHSCGAKASPDDKECPNCGASMQRRTGLVIFRVLGALVILGLGVAALLNHLPKKSKGGGGGGKGGPDLTVLPHVIQKEAGGNLTYVVGNIVNNSDNRYLGLKVEFELLGTNGAPVGTTSDYAPFLEPHRTWTYKAMVVDPDATSARLVNWSAMRYVEDPKTAEERKAAEKKKADEEKAKKEKKDKK